MDVYIGKWPVNGSEIELDALMAGLSHHSRYERYTGQDESARDFHYYVIHAGSTEEGWALIEQLNGTRCQGFRITAREYIERAIGRMPAADWDRKERRVNRVTSG
jgi:hypothetical protein